jgi:hypothetical protein
MKQINISVFPAEDPRPIEHQIARVVVMSVIGLVATTVIGSLYDKAFLKEMKDSL